VGDVGLLIIAGPALRSIDLSEPAWALEQVRNPANRLRAFAVVTNRAAIRAVVKALVRARDC